MSQASDVDGLLLRFLEAESHQTVRLPPPPPPEMTSQATLLPRTSSDDLVCASKTNGITRFLSPTDRDRHSSSSSGSGDTQEAAATPSDPCGGRPPTVIQDSTREPLFSPTPRAVAEENRGDREESGRSAVSEAPPVRSPSAPSRASSSCSAPRGTSAASSQASLSLSHPVVEFLTSAQLQGYATPIIEGLGLRTMAALAAYVHAEEEVASLLGPYASFQQQSELWRGLKRWEREEARRVRADAVERQRHALAQERAERQEKLQEKQRKKKQATEPRKSDEANADGSTPTHTSCQTTLDFFSQLGSCVGPLADACFRLSYVCDRAMEEPSTSHEPFDVSNGTSSGAAEIQQSARHRDQEPQQHQVVSSGALPSSPVSSLSLTTSATQLMRQLSYRCTHSRLAKHGRRRGRCEHCDDGGSNDSRRESAEKKDGRLSTEKCNSNSGPSAPIDVDVEEIDVEAETAEESCEEMMRHTHYYRLDARARDTDDAQAEEGEEEDEATRQFGERGRTRSPSFPSSESGLSSLLCSLHGKSTDSQLVVQERDEKEVVCTRSVEQTHSEGDALVSAHDFQKEPVSADERAIIPAREMSTSASTVLCDGSASMDLLGEDAHAKPRKMRNALLASRHVSLAALSVHAELAQLPLPPPRLRASRCSITREVAAPADGDPSAADTFTPPSEASLSQSSHATQVSDGEARVGRADDPQDQANGTEHDVSLHLIAKARVRLERAVREALETYNATVSRLQEAHGAAQASLDESVSLFPPLWAALRPMTPTVAASLASPREHAGEQRLVRWADVPCSSPGRHGAAEAPRFDFYAPSESHADAPATAPPRASSLRASADGRDTAEVIVSALTSAEVSARTTMTASRGTAPGTARSTALPSTFQRQFPSDSTQLNRPEHHQHGPGENAREDKEERADEPSTAQESGSDVSVGRLTAGTQRITGHTGTSRASFPRRTETRIRSAPLPALHSPQALHSAAHAEKGFRDMEGEKLIDHMEDSDAAADGGRESLLRVDEETQAASAAEASAPRQRSPPSPKAEYVHDASFQGRLNADATPTPRGERHTTRSNSQEWWDSYGIDALDYTQNHREGWSQGTSSASHAHVSPRIGLCDSQTLHESALSLQSPPAVDVVDVMSSATVSSEADSEVEVTLPIRSRSPEASHATAATVRAVRRPLAPTSHPPLPRMQNPPIETPSSPPDSAAPFPDVEDRLQPAVWQQMSLEELRALCSEYSLAAPVYETGHGNRKTSGSRSSPPSLRSPPPPPPPQRQRSPTPDSWSQYGLTTSAVAADLSSTACASPRTCRELFDASSNAASSPLPPLLPGTVDEERRTVSNIEHGDRAFYDSVEAEQHEDGHTVPLPSQKRRERRAALLEREACIAALQLLATRLRFQHVVAPHFLHRVERFSGLPYKRLRAADLIDESSLLTREDLQQARQRYKAEEQAEVERCVVSALAAQAAEEIERVAQHGALADGEHKEERGTGSPAGAEDASSGSGKNEGSPAWTASVPAKWNTRLSAFDQMLLREPVSTDSAVAAVQQSFAHISHSRVQQLLAANDVIAEVVVTVTDAERYGAGPSRSPSPCPPRHPASPLDSDALALATTQAPKRGEHAGSHTTHATLADSMIPEAPGTDFSPTKSPSSQSMTPPPLSQQERHRAQTRRYFAQRGYMARRGGTWGRGGRGNGTRGGGRSGGGH